MGSLTHNMVLLLSTEWTNIISWMGNKVPFSWEYLTTSQTKEEGWVNVLIEDTEWTHWRSRIGVAWELGGNWKLFMNESDW